MKNLPTEALQFIKELAHFRLYEVGTTKQCLVKDANSGKFLSLLPNLENGVKEVYRLFNQEIDKRNKKLAK